MPTEKKFKTVIELEGLIVKYFEDCENHEPLPKPFSVEGLADALEIDRRTLLNYEKEEGYEEYFPTVKKAKAKILKNIVERALMGENVPSVAIFILKNNFGFSDRQEVTGAEGKDLHPQPVTNIYISKPKELDD